MGLAKLFVKSIRVPVVRYEMPNMSQGGHYCSAGYRSQSTMIDFSPEDEQARKILAQSGIEFETVDLSERGGWKKLAAWVGRVRHTPTLLVKERPQGRYEGIRAISDYVTSQRKIVH